MCVGSRVCINHSYWHFLWSGVHSMCIQPCLHPDSFLLDRSLRVKIGVCACAAGLITCSNSNSFSAAWVWNGCSACAVTESGKCRKRYDHFLQVQFNVSVSDWERFLYCNCQYRPHIILTHERVTKGTCMFSLFIYRCLYCPSPPWHQLFYPSLLLDLLRLMGCWCCGLPPRSALLWMLTRRWAVAQLMAPTASIASMLLVWNMHRDVIPSGLRCLFAFDSMPKRS